MCSEYVLLYVIWYKHRLQLVHLPCRPDKKETNRKVEVVCIHPLFAVLSPYFPTCPCHDRSGRPASLDGYVRVFGHSSDPWAGGSVASVAPKEGGRVHGRFYLMTPQEVGTRKRKHSRSQVRVENTAVGRGPVDPDPNVRMRIVSLRISWTLSLSVSVSSVSLPHPSPKHKRGENAGGNPGLV